MRTFVFIPNLMMVSFVEVGEGIGSTICVVRVVPLYKSATTRNPLQLLPLFHFNDVVSWNSRKSFARVLFVRCTDFVEIKVRFIQFLGHIYTLKYE